MSEKASSGKQGSTCRDDQPNDKTRTVNRLCVCVCWMRWFRTSNVHTITEVVRVT